MEGQKKKKVNSATLATRLIKFSPFQNLKSLHKEKNWYIYSESQGIYYLITQETLRVIVDKFFIKNDVKPFYNKAALLEIIDDLFLLQTGDFSLSPSDLEAFSNGVWNHYSQEFHSFSPDFFVISKKNLTFILSEPKTLYFFNFS